MSNRKSANDRRIRYVGILGCVALILTLGSGCYSFRGSSVPPHLKTISLSPVVDNSGFGSSVYRDVCSQSLSDRLRSENALQFVDRDGDAKLSCTMSSIHDEAISVKVGEVERERKVLVSIEAEYYDAVKKRQIFKKTFTNSAVFAVATASTDRDTAIRTALQQDVDDIILAIVSGW